ncbi:MAG: glycosyl hydrolase family 28 protein [Anaerolineae bacterium]|nr:glycosyl hydrolase family 28 protein [Thermoflexales bacterium]MDW8406759.1 glycosyl hydrolase family 28 protein [Anaerolineae bacterium]
MAVYNILDFGAVGDGRANDASAIQSAIDTCALAGGGQVVIPAGRRFLSGTILLKSNVELHLERGATLAASGDPAHYIFRLRVGALSGGTPSPDDPAFGMLIGADRASNIAITGGGVIDGGGRLYIEEAGEYIHRMKSWRPFTVFLLGCSQVTLRDVTFHDAAVWTVRLSGCNDVLIDGIHIDNDLKLPNNDGIDLDRCQNVRIQGCHIVAGDDCISLKVCEETAAWGDGCENIVVSGCTLMSTSAALVVGCECRKPMRNIIFDSCVIRSSHRGLAIHLSEHSDVENVLFSNMLVETRIFHDKWWGRGEPIYITAIPWTEQHKIGHVRHVRFTNVLARSENGALIYGWEPGLIEDITLDHVRLEIDKWSKWPGGRQDIRPCPGEGLIKQDTHGVFVRNARNVTLRNCEVVWGANRPPYFRHALETHHVDNLILENFKGGSAHP